MAIRAVVFDIGGVLEITQDLSPTRFPQDSVTRVWEARLGLPAGEVDEAHARRLDRRQHRHDQPRRGAPGPQGSRRPGRRAGGRVHGRPVAEYLGTANTELIEYARGLRPRYRTGILSNSFSAPGNGKRRSTASRTSSTRSSTRTSADEQARPPDLHPDLQRLGVRPEETVFIDDYGPDGPPPGRQACTEFTTRSTPRPSGRSSDARKGLSGQLWNGP